MASNAKKVEQPESFEFTAANQKKIKEFISKYPKGKQQSAVLPLLDLAQRQNDNWVPEAAMRKIGEVLEMPYIRVYEVASFYTMFNLAPVGKNFIQVCRTTPCWLRGSDDITKVCKDKLKIGMGETTPDSEFTMVEVECLGACVNAPVVQINDHYYEDLNSENMGKLIDDLRAGKKPKIGSQIGRSCSVPLAGATTLKQAGKK